MARQRRASLSCVSLLFLYNLHLRRIDRHELALLREQACRREKLPLRDLADPAPVLSSSIGQLPAEDVEVLIQPLLAVAQRHLLMYSLCFEI